MVVQTRTSIYMLYHSFIFQKICTNLYKYIRLPLYFISKKYGTGRHAGDSSKWLRVGSKMKVNFAFIYSLTQNFALFFFLLKFVVKIKFLSQFSVLANFTGNIKKSLFICKQGLGKRRPVYTYISNTFSLALSFPLILYRRILIISFSLPIFGGKGIGECSIGYMRHSLFTSC